MAAPLTQESIRQLLLTNDRAVVRACMALYQRQLADEQAASQTRHKNGIGFNASDATLLSAVAKAGKFYLSGAEGAEAMAEENMPEVRKRILKYTGQLLQIAQQKQLDSML